MRINILFYLLILCTSLSAQINVSGTIRDFDSREPLDSAHITIEIFNKRVVIDAFTDKNGRYDVNIPFNITEGDYPITIKKPGSYDLTGIVKLQDGAVRDFFLRYRLLPEYKAEPPAPPVIDTPKVVEVKKEIVPPPPPVVEEAVKKDTIPVGSIVTAPVIVKEPEPIVEPIPEPIATTPSPTVIMPIVEGAVVKVDKIYFNANSIYLRKDSYAELDKIVDFLLDNPKIKVEIGGHTNGLCDDDFCLYLSDGRAKSVMDYIVSKGVAADRVSHKGYGKQLPIADNTTTAGRLLNQRVEMKIIKIEK